MQVILQQTIEKLGTAGQVVDVAPGYARNYLLPRRLAIEATPANLKRLEKIREQIARKAAGEKQAAAKLAELLAAVTLTIPRKAGETDQLFGSVTAADIAEALQAHGYQIEKRKILLEEPIKLIGEYEVALRLHPEVTASVKVQVVRQS
ncbi:MAG: 50S ribosomal protein L9 [Acidobacteriia bacterium]|jgi:large subunit ribosomal protein L9|nr:50S ribosomal protein L9 [Terriglobia bacterium]